MSRDHWLGDQNALEALVRFGDEEIKHQELFRRIERMCAEGMPEGYTFVPEPNAVASAVLSKSTWAVLALTCHIELFVLAHYHAEHRAADRSLRALEGRVPLPLQEESQHAIIDELEWVRENAKLTPRSARCGGRRPDRAGGRRGRDSPGQAAPTRDYFVEVCSRPLTAIELDAVKATVLAAYRWQYIVSGVQEPRFRDVLGSMITAQQGERIGAALAPIVA